MKFIRKYFSLFVLFLVSFTDKTFAQSNSDVYGIPNLVQQQISPTTRFTLKNILLFIAVPIILVVIIIIGSSILIRRKKSRKQIINNN